MDSLASLLDTTAARYGDRTAIVFADRRVSYAELDAMASRVANLLRSRGIGPGDTVALSCPNIPQFTEIYFGILRTGAAAVPLSVHLRAPEVAYHLDDAATKAYFCFEGTPDLRTGAAGAAGFGESACEHLFLITSGLETWDSALRDLPTFAHALARQPAQFATVDVDADDTAVIAYTSGRTGRPKGAQLRHRNMTANARTGETLFDSDSALPDTYLCVLPLSHAFGQTITQNGAIAYGGTMVMLPRFDAATALDLMRHEQVTVCAGVPAMYEGLLAALPSAGDVSALAQQLRLAVSGGTALPAQVHKQAEDRFGITILEGYGLAETSPVASFSRQGDPVRVGSIGVPIPGVEMTLLDPGSWDELPDGPDTIGEIAIRGHNVMKGYFRRPDETAQVLRDGWLRTGDLARRDAGGRFYIVERAGSAATGFTARGRAAV